jgi:MFS transporter, DHA1 family, tetracycline resistance protein
MAGNGIRLARLRPAATSGHTGPLVSRSPVPRGFGVLWATVAIDLAGIGIVFPVLGVYADRFGADGITVGLLVASYSLAQMVFAPLWGRVSDRVGRRPVILVALVGSAVGSLLTGVASTTAVLFAGRLVDGASGGSLAVAQAAVTDMAGPRERPRLLGLLGSAFAVGLVLGPALAALAGTVDGRAPFFVAAGLALANAGVAWFRLPETNPAVKTHASSVATTPGGAASPPRPPGSERDVALTNGPGYLRYVAAALVAAAAFSGFTATFSLLGERRFDLTVASVAAVFAVIGLGLAVVQAVLVGPAVRMLGVDRTLRWGLIGGAAGLAVLAAATTPAALAVALALVVIGHGIFLPTLASQVGAMAGIDARGAALGTQHAAAALARVVGPVVAGLLFERLAPGAAYLFAAGLLVVAATAIVPMSGGN